MALPDDVVEWVESTARGRMASAVRRPGGARKEAWFVDVEHDDGSRDALFLRFDRSDPNETKDPWTLHREAGVYLALQDTDVPVPRVLGVHPVRQAMLSERLEGDNWFSRIADPAEQEETARDFIVKLAALHRLDVQAMRIDGFPQLTTVREAVGYELDEWDSIIERRGGQLDPALEFTLHWLRRNVPDYEGPLVLVQGDTGPGNFMYRGGRVVAVVDWELAHLGDPMDDIAWLSLRATQEPFTDFAARLREYAELSGNAIDERRVHYYRVMAEAKLQVMAHGARAASGGGDVGNRLIYGLLHRRLWMEALGAAVGLEPPVAEPFPPRDAAEHDWLYGVVLDQLRDVVVPNLGDPLAVVRAKGLARIVKYLANVNAHGAAALAAEAVDIAALLGDLPPSVESGRTALSDAVREGRVAERDYLRYLWRRVARDTELARPAMGVLADRHWPVLR